MLENSQLADFENSRIVCISLSTMTCDIFITVIFLTFLVIYLFTYDMFCSGTDKGSNAGMWILCYLNWVWFWLNYCRYFVYCVLQSLLRFLNTYMNGYSYHITDEKLDLVWSTPLS